MLPTIRVNQSVLIEAMIVAVQRSSGILKRIPDESLSVRCVARCGCVDPTSSPNFHPAGALLQLGTTETCLNRPRSARSNQDREAAR